MPGRPFALGIVKEALYFDVLKIRLRAFLGLATELFSFR